MDVVSLEACIKSRNKHQKINEEMSPKKGLKRLALKKKKLDYKYQLKLGFDWMK